MPSSAQPPRAPTMSYEEEYEPSSSTTNHRRHHRHHDRNNHSRRQGSSSSTTAASSSSSGGGGGGGRGTGTTVGNNNSGGVRGASYGTTTSASSNKNSKRTVTTSLAMSSSSAAAGTNYRTSRRSGTSATTTTTTTRGEARQFTSNDGDVAAASKTSTTKTIALFGGTGKTGRPFLRLALDAGYRVRALVPPRRRRRRLPSRAARDGIDDEEDDDYDYGAEFGVDDEEDDEDSIDHPYLRRIVGDATDLDSIRHALRKSDYVVCLDGLTDALPDVTSRHYPASNYLTSFVRLLYPLMRQIPTIRVFLFQVKSTKEPCRFLFGNYFVLIRFVFTLYSIYTQSTSLASDLNGKTPIFSRVLKTAAYRRGLYLRDQDKVIQTVAREHRVGSGRARKDDDGAEIDVGNDDGKENAAENPSPPPPPPHFSFVVTRPSVFLSEGPASKKLSASKSQPGPFPITHAELAEFSLNALVSPKLYNTCPYVVP